ncbi:P-loop containing nucleoside triphosphate hydrolase protein [Globomyces pollinis-pini]|nr:P-loop containing nucleoside triphosphate hydrolase protein [Globomyces pollinis-pini]
MSNISVSIKIKPPNDTNMAVEYSIEPEHFKFNGNVFEYPRSVLTGNDQQAVYDDLAYDFIKKSEQGYSCTIIAYGQTGSGKTHTMLGPPGCLTENELSQATISTAIPEKWGILPRTLMMCIKDPTITIVVSAIEIYENCPFDLLENRKPLTMSTSDRSNIVVSSKPSAAHLWRGDHDPLKETFIHPSSCYCRQCYTSKHTRKVEKQKEKGQAQSGITKSKFSTVGEHLRKLETPVDIAHLVRTVETTRTAQSHLLNDRSSRSHCLVRAELTRKSNGKALTSQLLFVDLAGSERILKSGATGKLKDEAVDINQSLSVLGRVITQLGQGSTHVSYRDSTLTMLLRSSLIGESITSVVVCLSGDMGNADESLSSLRYGKSMNAVRSHIVKHVEGKSIVIQVTELQSQISALKVKLQDMENNGQSGGFDSNANITDRRIFQDNVEKLERLKIELQRLREAYLENKSDSICKKKLALCQAEVDNYRDIVTRQKSIKGFWNTPSICYTQAQNELSALEGKLKSLP